VIDKAIDDALLAGMTQLRIIHGKGTGMLRAGLLSYLSGYSSVKNMETAPISEGGSGATIVYF
ncbi:MAG: Smr/MutS family protein, partial [Acidaminococcaceae bacterium]